MGGMMAGMSGAAGQVGANMREDYKTEHDNAMQNLTGFMNFLRSQAQNEQLHPTARSIWGGWYSRLASAPVAGRLKMAEQIHKESEQLGQTVLAGHQMITAGQQPPANLPPGLDAVNGPPATPASTPAMPTSSAMQAPPQTIWGAPSAQAGAYSTGLIEEAKRKGDVAAAEAWSEYFSKHGVADEDIPFHVESMLGRPMPSSFFFHSGGSATMTGKDANAQGYLQANKQPWPDDAWVKPSSQRGQKVGIPTIPPSMVGSQETTTTTQTPTGSVTNRTTKKELPGQDGGAQPPPARPGGGGGGAGGGFLKPAAQKIFDPMFDAEARLRTMNNNLQAGLKGDQQAMVSMVANHISMVLGIPIGKVGRPSYLLMQEAEKSAPFFGRLMSRTNFDEDGFLKADALKLGITLTPGQMQSMVKLARDQYTNYRKVAISKATKFGVKNAAGIAAIPDDIQGMLGQGGGMQAPPAGVRKPPKTAADFLQQSP